MQIALRRANGETVCERCVVADTALTRMRGLLGRRELPGDAGIFLRPASSVHTAFMRFPIDVVFVDRDNRVVSIAEDVSPWRIRSARGAKAVIELRAGEARRRGVSVGDRLDADEPRAQAADLPTRRGQLLKRAGGDFLLAALWLAFAISNLHEWRTHHRPVGLGIIVLELMFAMLFFVRRTPWVTSSSPIAWVATAVGAFGMLGARPAYDPVLGLEPLYIGLQLAGAATAAYTLTSLGRSFGLVAANRGIQTGGAYAFIRHPLYACYAAADLGYILENPSPRNIALALLTAAFQVVRIQKEEDCLRADPEYVRYSTLVRYRLVPRVW